MAIPPPAAAPMIMNSARMMGLFGLLGILGGIALEITRASVTGKDCCCIAS
ncbi:hypothetical protein D3C80_414890 [compost metagenome]